MKCIFCNDEHVQEFRIGPDNVVYQCHHCGKSFHSDDVKKAVLLHLRGVYQNKK